MSWLTPAPESLAASVGFGYANTVQLVDRETQAPDVGRDAQLQRRLRRYSPEQDGLDWGWQVVVEAERRWIGTKQHGLYVVVHLYLKGLRLLLAKCPADEYQAETSSHFSRQYDFRGILRRPNSPRFWLLKSDQLAPCTYSGQEPIARGHLRLTGRRHRTRLRSAQVKMVPAEY